MPIKKERIQSDVYSIDGLKALFRESADLLNDNRQRGLNILVTVKSKEKREGLVSDFSLPTTAQAS